MNQSIRHLERLIISASLTERGFEKVRYLEPKDFFYFESYWDMVVKSKGDLLAMVKNLPQDIQDKCFMVANYTAREDVQYMSLKLIELRFERILSCLLGNLSRTTKNPVEASLLTQCQNIVGVKDVFDLSDVLLKYIGHQVTEVTKRRVIDFINYRDKRVEEVKKITNG